jgi:DNA-binding HxlR family transcriptional regulator
MVEPYQLQPLMHILGKKWTLPILQELSLHSRSFGELQRLISPISSKTLSEFLLELQYLELISRNPQLGKGPLRVLYRIRKKGKTVVEAVNQLQQKMEATK